MHIHEAISEDRLRMLRTTPDMYESIQARFATVVTALNHTNNDDDDGDDDDENNNTVPLPVSATTTTTTTNHHFFLEINIHPSRLCRIPPSFLASTTGNNITSGTNTSNIVCDRLPVNCVIVRFSDQTIRIHPSQYQLLDSYYHNQTSTSTLVNSHNDIISTPKKINGGQGVTTPLSPNHSTLNISLSMNGSFFEDDVFHTLDDVTSYQPSASKADDLGMSDTHPTLSPLDGNANHTTNEYNEGDNIIDKVSFMSLLDSKGNFEVAVRSDVNDDEQQQQPDPLVLSSPNDTSRDIVGSDTINEMDYLLKRIEQETLALSQEQQQFKNNVLHVQSWMDRIRTVEAQNQHIRQELDHEQMQRYRDQFILEAQRIRLIREVARIYPVTVVRNVHFYIHGLEIPFDLYSGHVSEEVISAAFGFLCHTTYLISKYLGIHIRYRLHCQSSRSAIQDTNGSTYPLFPGRQVEREQFEYGVHLLHRNVDCICKCRGIQQRLLQPSNQIHILAKILRIYDNVIDGY